jgi:NAD(P)-dependent dehydrogenase (short-subunit alcohol dehydrogenase family)
MTRSASDNNKGQGDRQVKIDGSVVAIIAGGGGGFGGATARRLHAAGANVVICELDEAKGKAMTDELGDRSAFAQTDVTDEASVLNAISLAEDLGDLRIAVIAHGGGGAGGRTLDRNSQATDQAGFMQTVNMYLGATYNFGRLAAASMAKTEPLEEGERGVIINTASIAAFEGTIGQAAYSAAKGGVVGMTLPMARDLAPVGIRVCTIAPGTFLTPAFQRAGDPEALDAMWGAAVPFPKRMGRAPEYAQLAQQIVENIYLNGETIRIDGALRFTPRGAK